MLDKPKTNILCTVLLASTMGWVGIAAAHPAPQEKVEERIKKLEKSLDAHRALLKLQNEQLKGMEERQERVERWLAAVPGALAKMNAGLAKAREEGFTAAGANIPARVTLLESLEGLASDLTPKAEEKETSRR